MTAARDQRSAAAEVLRQLSPYLDRNPEVRQEHERVVTAALAAARAEGRQQIGYTEAYEAGLLDGRAGLATELRAVLDGG